MSTIIDRIFYEHWVVAPLNFMQFNIMSGGSSFYGTNPWHWYFSQGIPAVLGVNVVPFLLGIRCSNTKIPLLLIIWFTAVLRFVCVCVPFYDVTIFFRYTWLSWPFKKWNFFLWLLSPKSCWFYCSTGGIPFSLVVAWLSFITSWRSLAKDGTLWSSLTRQSSRVYWYFPYCPVPSTNRKS